MVMGSPGDGTSEGFPGCATGRPNAGARAEHPAQQRSLQIVCADVFKMIVFAVPVFALVPVLD